MPDRCCSGSAGAEWCSGLSSDRGTDTLQATAMTSSSTQRTKEGLVYQRIKALLVGHAFAPGEKILAHSLADRLGVSGTPVREALIRLQAENFLSATPNRGFFFKPINLDEMTDLYRFAFMLLRNSIEAAFGGGGMGGNGAAGNGMAGSNGGGGGGGGGGGVSVVIPDTPASADITPDYYAAFIEELYTAIVSMAESRTMNEVMRNILERTRFVRRIDLELPGHLAEIRPLMAELVDLLRAGDTDGVLHNLAKQRKRKFAVLPDLVKEGLIRSCSN
jgi:DNA-binding GntR family transcriptional regulator